MAHKIMIFALVFFAMVCCMASTTDDVTAALKDAADAPIAVENNNIIGTINGSHENGAAAAAPIGGPVSGNSFPNITLPSVPSGATTNMPDFITIATTIVSVAVVGSFFSE